MYSIWDTTIVSFAKSLITNVEINININFVSIGGDSGPCVGYGKILDKETVNFYCA